MKRRIILDRNPELTRKIQEMRIGKMQREKYSERNSFDFSRVMKKSAEYY